jgi:hypothetical protein
LENPAVNGNIISKWIVRNMMGGCGLDSSGTLWEPAASCKHDNEPSGSLFYRCHVISKINKKILYIKSVDHFKIDVKFLAACP